jgi:uncharacterized RDD family membrane protein YckC
MENLYSAPQGSISAHTVPAAAFTEYAGFWRRFGAFIIDQIVVFIGSFVAGFVIGFVAVAAGQNDPRILTALGNIAGIIITWLYFAKMESSEYQATVGKLALGIKVCDESGQQIGFGRATGRYFGKILSAVILCIGFFMIAFTERKQGLHDSMSGCLVVRK